MPAVFFIQPHAFYRRTLQSALIEYNGTLFFCVIEFRQKKQRRLALLLESVTVIDLGATVAAAFKKIGIYQTVFCNWKANAIGSVKPWQSTSGTA